MCKIGGGGVADSLQVWACRCDLPLGSVHHTIFASFLQKIRQSLTQARVVIAVVRVLCAQVDVVKLGVRRHVERRHPTHTRPAQALQVPIILHKRHQQLEPACICSVGEVLDELRKTTVSCTAWSIVNSSFLSPSRAASRLSAYFEGVKRSSLPLSSNTLACLGMTALLFQYWSRLYTIPSPERPSSKST